MVYYIVTTVLHLGSILVSWSVRNRGRKAAKKNKVALYHNAMYLCTKEIQTSGVCPYDQCVSTFVLW